MSCLFMKRAQIGVVMGHVTCLRCRHCCLLVVVVLGGGGGGGVYMMDLIVVVCLFICCCFCILHWDTVVKP